MWRNGNTHSLLVELENDAGAWKIARQFLKRLNVMSQQFSPGCRHKMCVLTKSCTWMFIAFFISQNFSLSNFQKFFIIFHHNSQKCKWSKCPSADEWIKKLWCSCLKNTIQPWKGIEIHATTWINLKNITQSERARHTNTYCMISLIQNVYHQQI